MGPASLPEVKAAWVQLALALLVEEAQGHGVREAEDGITCDDRCTRDHAVGPSHASSRNFSARSPDFHRLLEAPPPLQSVQ